MLVLRCRLPNGSLKNAKKRHHMSLLCKFCHLIGQGCTGYVQAMHSVEWDLAYLHQMPVFCASSIDVAAQSYIICDMTSL